ncbi:UDP-galactopyranose mutase [Chthonobacter albigriseus]|uniref:UDP-galactopyranose mutase n=1 Tax=Chthonobacter albigriseus TaxID=1683161 RepID=UPI001FCE63F5|nr:UDP-galactopyranose mutase [Chthonobacter albigriseus]
MTPTNRRILVVGAGFAGAVHARTLAENGYRVHVIDRRPHIGGNAYDRVDENGIRVHVYGPHLFHTKNEAVIAWLKRFGRFTPYQHKVRVRLPDGATAPLPINRTTVNIVHGTDLQTEAEVKAFLASVAVPIAHPANAAEYLYSRIGTALTDLFFRPYTRKMWLMELEDMAASVVQRIPINYDDTDTYFERTQTQMMPVDGYTALFDQILSHEAITVDLGVGYEKGMERDYGHCFTSMPIDEYFDYVDGELPYRSIRFHHRTATEAPEQGWSVTNFTDDGPLTRETAWHIIPHHLVERTGRYTYTAEEPCDYKDNGFERYYPVKTADGRFQARYDLYKERAKDLATISFIGRCGTYQYLDMDQVINQSLAHVGKWIAERSGQGAA